MRKSLLSLAVLSALSVPTLSFAEDAVAPAAAAPASEPTPNWTFPGSATFVSDYIFRGQSQTWGKPAAQVAVEANHKSGFYAGFFASNVSDQWLPGANLETDLYAGFRSKFGESDFGYDVGAIGYFYTGADWDKSAFAGTKSNSIDTGEAYLGLSYKWLTFKTGITFTEYWGWNTNNSGVGAGFNGDLKAGVTGDTEGSYYFELNGLYEVLPTWNLSGQIGQQIIADSKGLDITYYKAGVSKSFDAGWSAGLTYSGSNEPDAYKKFLSLSNTTTKSDIAKDTVFVTISKSF